MLPQFCFPIFDDITTHEFKMPSIHHFVLTNDKGQKMYGTCLTIWEEYKGAGARREPPGAKDGEGGGDGSEVHSSSGGSKSAGYLPRVLCLLSTWPYLTAFREYLTQLWRLATTTDLMPAPIERYVLNVCAEVPAPPPGAFEMRMDILNSAIRFWAPPANQPIPYVSLPFHVLFECLDLKNILFVWYGLAIERKVLLLSSQASLLTVCAEILCSLLFPMQWSHLYIPLLPKFLSPMLDAPMPYLCGICRENLAAAADDISDDTIVVDLDKNTITVGDETPELPALPLNRRKKLEYQLESNAGDVFWNARGITKERARAVRQSDELRKAREDSRAEERMRGSFWSAKGGQLSGHDDEAKKKEGGDGEVTMEKLMEQADEIWNEKLRNFDEAFNLAYTPAVANIIDGNESGKGGGAKDGDDDDEGQSQWDAVQEAFLRFYVSALKNYRTFLVEPGSDAEPSNLDLRWSECASFRTEEFVESQTSDYHPFLRELCATQQFDDFICKRRGRPDVIFFDQSIDAKMNRSKRKFKKKLDTLFLQSAKAHKVLKAVSAVEPNKGDLPFDGPVDVDDVYLERTFVYKTWPEKFDDSLFGEPRPFPHMINAEFDRQAALAERLGAKHAHTDDDGLWEESVKDSDPSPEVATFTVYFAVSTAAIGREFLKLEKERRERMTGRGGEKEQLGGKEEEGQHHRSSATRFLKTHSVSVTDICPSEASFSSLPSPWSAQEHLDRVSREEARLEEACAVAKAQLDLAFNALAMMRQRNLIGDVEVYKSMVEACGRCGDSTRANELLAILSHDGLVTDGEMLSCYMSAFSISQSSPLMKRLQGDDVGTVAKTKSSKNEYSIVDEWKSVFDAHVSGAKASFTESHKRMSRLAKDEFNTWLSSPGDDNGGQSVASSTVDSSSVSSALSSNGKTGGNDTTSKHSSLKSSGADAFSTPTTKRHRSHGSQQKRSSSLMKKHKLFVTETIDKQLIMGESLLEFLYPDLSIDTDSDTCPQCSTVMTGDDVIFGWKPCEFRDYTTGCPRCGHRFVPRFSVSCSSPAFHGSQGKSTPLYCEFLSPWVLRKELQNAIKSGEGIDTMLDPKWRSGADINSTLWWNMVTSFIRFRLPITLLLQGNFENQLIAPSPVEDDSGMLSRVEI